jgi:hypothetical protein
MCSSSSSGGAQEKRKGRRMKLSLPPKLLIYTETDRSRPLIAGPPVQGTLRIILIPSILERIFYIYFTF